MPSAEIRRVLKEDHTEAYKKLLKMIVRKLDIVQRVQYSLHHYHVPLRISYPSHMPATMKPDSLPIDSSCTCVYLTNIDSSFSIIMKNSDPRIK